MMMIARATRLPWGTLALAAPRQAQLWRRGLSSSSSRSSPVPPGLARFIADLTHAPPTVHTEVLDPIRAAHLHRTLPTRQQDKDGDVVREGEVLPEGWVWAYFQPESWLRDLGADGSSVEYNAPTPYTRRMWASGTFTFPSASSSVPTTNKQPRADTALRIGQPATCRTRVSQVEYKKDMVFVTQARDVWRGEQVGADEEAGVREERVHVFRRAVSTSTPPSSIPTPAASAQPPRPASSSASAPTTPSNPPLGHSFIYTPTPQLLFRFSALTFNAHLIHYSLPHTQAVERHPDLLVHGPLSSLVLLELACKAAKELGGGRRVRKWEYRAVRPVLVGREVECRWTITGNGGGDSTAGYGVGAGQRVEAEVWQGGEKCMWGIATLES